MVAKQAAAQTVAQIAHYTPFSYFFEVGIGVALGVAVVAIPGLWIYRRYIKREA